MCKWIYVMGCYADWQKIILQYGEQQRARNESICSRVIAHWCLFGVLSNCDMHLRGCTLWTATTYTIEQHNYNYQPTASKHY